MAIDRQTARPSTAVRLTPAWRHKAAAVFAAGWLLGCATPPGGGGPLGGTVPAVSQVHEPAAVVHRKSDPKGDPFIANGRTGVVTNALSDGLAAPVSASPSETPDAPWTQRGRASWYGKKFHGRRTANGERFNAMALTAAHRSLPMPSYARVRLVGSSKEVVVRINDRGPFHAGRVLDLSYAAARQLGIVGRGSALVDIAPLAADYVPADDSISGATTQGVP